MKQQIRWKKTYVTNVCGRNEEQFGVGIEDWFQKCEYNSFLKINILR